MSRASQQRHSGPLIADGPERAAIEARNALLQFDEVRRLFGERGSDLRLTPADICHLQGIAVRDIFQCAGKFRSEAIIICNSQLRPPRPGDVASLVDEMCARANELARDAFQASAYLMWRLNWIHPFADGNGRTSRAVSYLALCCGLGMELPGTTTVPDLIVQNKIPYYAALDSADAAWRRGALELGDMVSLIQRLLEQQLRTAV